MLENSEIVAINELLGARVERKRVDTEDALTLAAHVPALLEEIARLRATPVEELLERLEATKLQLATKEAQLAYTYNSSEAYRKMLETEEQRSRDLRRQLGAAQEELSRREQDEETAEKLRDGTISLPTVGPTDNAPCKAVLEAILECANAWQPDARIIGNIRAYDIARSMLAALEACRIRATELP